MALTTISVWRDLMKSIFVHGRYFSLHASVGKKEIATPTWGAFPLAISIPVTMLQGPYTTSHCIFKTVHRWALQNFFPSPRHTIFPIPLPGILSLFAPTLLHCVFFRAHFLLEALLPKLSVLSWLVMFSLHTSMEGWKLHLSDSAPSSTVVCWAFVCTLSPPHSVNPSSHPPHFCASLLLPQHLMPCLALASNQYMFVEWTGFQSHRENDSSSSRKRTSKAFFPSGPEHRAQWCSPSSSLLSSSALTHCSHFSSHCTHLRRPPAFSPLFTSRPSSSQTAFPEPLG